MADHSKIEWTEATWNPIAGCTIVSPGCTNCYAMRDAHRLAGNPNPKVSGKYAGTTTLSGRRGAEAGTGDREARKPKPVWTGRVNLASEETLTQPLRWKEPRRIFVNSMSDLFHEAVPDEWIDRIFAVMALCPQHTFQVLTKRPERMRECMSQRHELDFSEKLMRGARQSAPLYRPWTVQLADWAIHPGHPGKDLPLSRDPHILAARQNAQSFPLPNVWLGVSAEDQRRADERIPILLDTPAAIRWVSAEPLLGPIDFTRIDHERGRGWEEPLNALQAYSLAQAREDWGDDCDQLADRPRLDWIVAGGESGPGARPMHPDWDRSIRDQCAAAGLPFLFKQWGQWVPHFKQRKHQVGRRIESGMPGSRPAVVFNVGKTAAGRMLDGIEHNGFPDVRA